MTRQTFSVPTLKQRKFLEIRKAAECAMLQR